MFERRDVDTGLLMCPTPIIPPNLVHTRPINYILSIYYVIELKIKLKTMPEFTFKRIEDVEIEPVDFDIHTKTVGSSRTGIPFMLTFTHHHSTDIRSGESSLDSNTGEVDHKYYTGKAYVFLTAEQLRDLHNKLTRLLFGA